MVNEKTYIGIDPGSKGFIAVIKPDGKRAFEAIADNDPYNLNEFLRAAVHEAVAEFKCDVVCCMEEIHAVYGSSAGSTFAFGEMFGLLKGLLVANNIPYHLVPPKTWQKEMWVASDKVHKSTNRIGKDGKPIKAVDNKPTSINAARRLFPDVDFRRTEKCKAIDDNKCDAMLICDYGRRKNL